MEIVLELPLPPSVNAAFANRRRGKGRGRIKTRAYRSWIDQADRHLLMQKRGLPREPILGQLRLEINVPASMRGDISNRIKLVEDFLVSRDITADDKNNWEVLIKRDKSITCCVVKISIADQS